LEALACKQAVPCEQAEQEPCIELLPSAAATVEVAFYGTAAAVLEQRSAVVAAVLKACSRTVHGKYSVGMDALLQAANQSPAQVSELGLGWVSGPQKRQHNMLCQGLSPRSVHTANFAQKEFKKTVQDVWTSLPLFFFSDNTSS
jgi:hypothetical protein